MLESLKLSKISSNYELSDDVFQTLLNLRCYSCSQHLLLYIYYPGALVLMMSCTKMEPVSRLLTSA